MNLRRGVLAALLAVGLGVVASGWVTVGPGEVLVVHRLGRVLTRPWHPGGHWAWPLGVDRTERIQVDEVRRREFGRVEVAGSTDEPGDGEFLTGDLNLIRARGVIQYRVSDPIAFALLGSKFEQVLDRATEAALARALASGSVDVPLGSGRAEVAESLRADLARSVDRLSLGVAILGVNLTDARPPVEVEPAYLEAQAAQTARSRRISEAETLAARLRPAALALAEDRLDRANAEASRSVALAGSSADRFVNLLAEVSRSRELTIRRLYRETLLEVLPRVRRKILMTPDEPVDLGLFGDRPR